MERLAALFVPAWRRIIALWNRDANGKATVAVGGMFVVVTLGALLSSMGGSSAPAHAPELIATQRSARELASSTPRPTRSPRPTDTAEPPTATDVPATPRPTRVLPTAAPPAATRALQPALAIPQEPVQPAPQARRSGAPQGSSCPGDLPVKGNRGSNGWIYHVPGARSYNQTKPEECFATAEDAAAAGYRAPRN